MFRKKSPQRSLFEVGNLLPDAKRKLLDKSWAKPFAEKALPLIIEDDFKCLYCENNGAPNKPVQTVVGVLILKDMFDFTDQQALDALEFDLRRQFALGLTPAEAHCCQKTLHNFRTALIAHDRGRLLFEKVTDGIITALGINVDRQRLDSTHIVSNMAHLSRLGLFCETIRVVLRDLKRGFPGKFAEVPAGLRGRYLADDGADNKFEDAPSSDAKRRLAVAGRDLWRLCERFRGDPKRPESLDLADRLLREQCEITAGPAAPAEGDADAGDAPAPAVVKEPKAISPDSMQSPHDPDATYGHKGKGYEAQVCETVGNGDDKPEIITHVLVTPSCKSDAEQVMPTLENLAGRKLQPKEAIVDTTYASTENAIDCAGRGTELVGPVGGRKPAADAAGTTANVPETPAVDAAAAAPVATEPPAATAPAATGTASAAPAVKNNGRLLDAAKAAAAARTSPPDGGPPVVDKQSHRRVLDERRRYEKTGEFEERYDQRAGIEATNSELKRAHGLGKLRVRGGARVKLAVYLKALACNVKRMVAHLAAEAARSALRTAAQAPAGGDPTILTILSVRRAAA